ncbi:MAG: glutamine--fructose-6-phosphate transaminase (isomerizing) [Planctomycetes bacterium]|nr:glutamine--fructose-6-phosphate transaminase (isomerizing) [Planctomycetota bacterium]
MCGIIGYSGRRPAVPIILDGLRRLEYRGYDSAGVVVCGAERLLGEKERGRLDNLVRLLALRPLAATTGVGHTRWATHGPPSKENSHPHYSQDETFAVVHNGIIENFHDLRRGLERRGVRFRSQTDTEVIVHLIAQGYEGDLLEAFRRALEQLRGAYAVLLVSSRHPDEILAARHGSPLIVGVGEGENFLASDVPAILPYTRRAIYLKENRVARVTPAGVEVYDLAATARGRGARTSDGDGAGDGAARAARLERSSTTRVVTIDLDIKAAEKEGFDHFMVKEIHEQPRAIEETMRGRVRGGEVVFDDFPLSPARLRKFNRVSIIACGTAWHAGLVAKFAIEEFARMSVDAVISSEFRYANLVLGRRDLVIAVSQSGETADTLAGVREARRLGATVVTICNVVGSSIPRESNAVLYTHAGPEVAVASTKAYTTQMALLLLFALRLARARGAAPRDRVAAVLEQMRALPGMVRETIGNDRTIRQIAAKYHKVYNYLFVGRRYNYPTAFEGALKLKEISYIHAEGYQAGELKHGPIALVDGSFPTVAICVRSPVYEKMLSNIQEIKARGGLVLAVASKSDRRVSRLVDWLVRVPDTDECLSPILAVIPLQLLAYHVSVRRGLDPDRPRNLAKSVTVE